MKNQNLFKDLDGYIKINMINDITCSKKLKEKVDMKSLTYGTTPFNTFKKIYEKVKIKPNRFIVVGCSIGWMNFYFNELNQNIKTIGIDIHDNRVSFGNELINKYNLNNIELKLESFEEFQFMDGDLIWQSNLCFPKEKTLIYNEKLFNERNNISIISYVSLNRLNIIKDLNHDRIALPVSWYNKQSFYIYEKI